ncbi:MAG TPA: M23 family metallopeptidase [Bryobacteraceae bacterium]|nr:M23 family peptidase [Bryobacterales bacterium]HRJ19250.1 M23 family metallopeptidase [Bryobacteraceae bacterium]
MKTAFLAVALLLLIGAPALLFLLSTSSELALDPDVSILGASTKVGVRVSNPHGIRALRVKLEQDSSLTTASVEAPADRWLFWKKREPAARFDVQIKADPRQGFRSGPARLTVETISNDFRGRTDVLARDVQVNLAPPVLTVTGDRAYLTVGGAGLVTFRVTGYWTEAGVRVGDYEFRSYPVPGGSSDSDRFCLFVFPFDVPATTNAVVFARNPAGAQVTASFPQQVAARQWRQRQLPVSDAFLEKIVPRLDPSGQGSLLDRFLHINREIRRSNNQTIADLKLQSEPRFLWENPFEQLSNTKVEALFADYRSYIYNGAKVDEQVHLGFDLSKVARAPVTASNHGKIVFAGDLGIYGLCVVIDHGYTLQSIYAHLSEISVKAGQSVRRGEEIGRSGETGLAGGDHLHFGMQIEGIQTNPLEWWDRKWIQEKILDRLPAR